MAISEAAKADLYTGLGEVPGNDRAELLMSAIPLHDLDQVATKANLAVLQASPESGFADLRSGCRGGALATEPAALRESFSTWIPTVLVTIVGAMVGVWLVI